MAEQETGMIFTQEGVAVRGSADYQKILDSRWRFMELEVEKAIKSSLPAHAAVLLANEFFEKTSVLNHNLGFIPFFETDINPASYSSSELTIWADKRRIFIRRLISTSDQPAEVIQGRIRVYNLPVLEEYVAKKEFVIGSSSPEGSVGARFLEEGGGANLKDVSPTGFSIDTRKKILSIHRHGLARINDYTGRLARCSSIDVTADVLTITNQPGAPYGGSIEWIKTHGQAVNLSPSDFVTFPGGLNSGPWYIIPIDATHIKLASSYANALAGTAVNITSTGSLPMQLTATSSGITSNENAIFHDVGYPPTFLLAPTNFRDFFFSLPETETYVGPMQYLPPTRTQADDQYIRFFGIQAAFSGQYGYVILKDPVEIAQ